MNRPGPDGAAEEQLRAAQRRLHDLSRQLERSFEAERRERARADRIERRAVDAEQEARRARGALEHRDEETERLREQVADESRRRQEAERGRLVLEHALHQAREDLEAIAASRAWRLGHAVTRRLRFSAPVTQGRVAVALDRLDRVAAEVDPTSAYAIEAGASRRQLPRGSAAAEAEAEAAQAQSEFLRQYEALVPAGDETDRAQPSLADRRSILAPPDAQPSPSVDVVICVRDAAEDLRRCVWSLLERTERPFRLIIVDDGSGPETARILGAVADGSDGVIRIRRDEPPHGYTLAANAGVAAADADWIVLLNSDTIVTRGWLDRLLDAAESDPALAVVGPLSNAASHQSVPVKRENGAWSTNPLPAAYTEDAVAQVVRTVSELARPRVTFVNGFCFAMRRAAVEHVGPFDEEHFASGYCEENDFCVRAQDAGWSMAIADDAYVFHAKSRSYTTEGRAELAKRNYEAFLQKHGPDRIRTLVAAQEADDTLEPLRDRVARALERPELVREAIDADTAPLHVVFVLPGLSDGGSGGAHSVYQEAAALRDLGVPARVALPAAALERARELYEDADAIFETYDGDAGLAACVDDADVVVATHFVSVAPLAEIVKGRPDLLAAYYVQDFEPLFHDPASPSYLEAVESYTRLPSALLFAKTHWLCNVVWDALGLPVAKVEPSLDTLVYNAYGRSERPHGPVRILAMVRPRTPRRQAHETVAVLDALLERHGGDVEVRTFGCTADRLEALGASAALLTGHAGILPREDVADLMRSSDVFVDCSIYQAFGRTALEAMACGCVPVVPAVGGAAEFARHGENAMVVDTLDREAVLTAVGDLVAAPERLDDARDAALRTASGYSTTRAALSEYVLFREAHDRIPAVTRVAPDAG